MWNNPSATLDYSAAAGAAVGLYLFLLASGTITALLLLSRHRRAPVDWRPRSSRLCQRDWSWRDGGRILGIQCVLMLGAMLLASCLDDPAPVTLIILQTLLLDGIGLICLWVYLKQLDRSWMSAFGNQDLSVRRAILTGLVFYLALLPLLVFSSLVYQGILSANGYPPGIQEVALLLAQQHPFWIRLYLILLAVVLAPVFEECLFRGIALPILARRIGTGPAVLSTSVLFATIHFHLPSFIPLCVMAVGFSIGYLYSGSLWVPITMHAVFNGINLLLLTMITP